jgi:hypothetical protein
MQRRRRVKHQFTLQDRIVSWAKAVRAQAAELPPGPDREMLLRKVQQTETDMHLEAWPSRRACSRRSSPQFPAGMNHPATW